MHSVRRKGVWYILESETGLSAPYNLTIDEIDDNMYNSVQFALYDYSLPSVRRAAVCAFRDAHCVDPPDAYLLAAYQAVFQIHFAWCGAIGAHRAARWPWRRGWRR